MGNDLALVDDAIRGLQNLKKRLRVDPAHIEKLEYQLEYYKKQAESLEADLKQARFMASDQRFKQLVDRNMGYSHAIREAIKLCPTDSEVSKFLRTYKDGACRCGLPFTKHTLELHAKYPDQYAKVGKRTFYLCDECWFCGQGEKPCTIKTKRRAKVGARDAVSADTTARGLLKTFITAAKAKDEKLLKRTAKVAQQFIDLGKEPTA